MPSMAPWSPAGPRLTRRDRGDRLPGCRQLSETAADLLGRANAVAVGGQQHGMVALDADGGPDPDALLWDDTRSAAAATELVAERGEVAGMSDAVGSVPVAWFTVTKWSWLRDHEPERATRTHALVGLEDVKLTARGVRVGPSCPPRGHQCENGCEDDV